MFDSINSFLLKVNVISTTTYHKSFHSQDKQVYERFAIVIGDVLNKPIEDFSYSLKDARVKVETFMKSPKYQFKGYIELANVYSIFRKIRKPKIEEYKKHIKTTQSNIVKFDVLSSKTSKRIFNGSPNAIKDTGRLIRDFGNSCKNTYVNETNNGIYQKALSSLQSTEKIDFLKQSIYFLTQAKQCADNSSKKEEKYILILNKLYSLIDNTYKTSEYDLNFEEENIKNISSLLKDIGNYFVNSEEEGLKKTILKYHESLGKKTSNEDSNIILGNIEDRLALLDILKDKNFKRKEIDKTNEYLKKYFKGKKWKEISTNKKELAKISITISMIGLRIREQIKKKLNGLKGLTLSKAIFLNGYDNIKKDLKKLETMKKSNVYFAKEVFEKKDFTKLINITPKKEINDLIETFKTQIKIFLENNNKRVNK